MTLEIVLVVCDFIQQFLADKHKPLLLLISEKPRHKLDGDPSHVQVLG
jgi:hypothetical protein